MSEIVSGYAMCLFCKHLKDGWVCPAFPNGIPNDIISAENDHSEKHPDQKNDIVFEEKD